MRNLGCNSYLQERGSMGKIIGYPTIKLVGESHLDDKWNVEIGFLSDQKVEKISMHHFDPQLTTCEPIGNYFYHRFAVSVLRANEKTHIPYTIFDKTINLSVPPAFSSPHFTASSCDGTQYSSDEDKVKDKGELWSKIPSIQESNELMVLNGDQLYCDGIWKEPLFAAWWELPKMEKLHTPFTPKMEEQALNFYLNKYIEKFEKVGFGKETAEKATIMIWDDHDIVDGWGSYTEEFQNCPVLQGIFKVAKQCFSLFQQPLKTENDAFFSKDDYSALHVFNGFAIASLDTRSNRTLEKIVSETTYEALFEKLEMYSGHIQHLVVALSIPILYQDLTVGDTLIELGNEIGQNLKGIMKHFPGTELYKFFYDSPEGKINLTDDGMDHWNHENHKAEAIEFTGRLVNFARAHNIRVHFISGDVHLGTMRKGKSKEKIPFANDPAGMIQFTSSPSYNVPAPLVMKVALSLANANSQSLGEAIKEVPCKWEKDGQAEEFFLKRNIASFSFAEDGSLLAKLHVELDDGTMEEWTKTVPKLSPELVQQKFCVLL